MLVRTSETSWDLMGSLPLHDLSELTGEKIEEEGITTSSGWATQKLGGFPKPGDLLKLGRYELKVEEMDGLRVERLKLTKLPEPPPAES